MAISIDDTVARFTDNGVTTTSASFTPANNSLIVLCVTIDRSDGAGVNPTVSGGSLVWTNRVEHDGAEDTGGHASIWTAPVGTGASMTISVDPVTGGRVSCKPYIITGQHASPIGTNSEGHSTTNNLTTALASTTGAGRWIYCGVDWNALGLPSSTDTEDAAHYAGAISVESCYKASDHTASQVLNISLDASGAGAADWNWAALEILAAAGAAPASPPDGGSHQRNVRRNPVYRMKGRIYVPARLAA